MYKIHVINGPNLNLLSERNSEIYGAITLEDICKKITNACDETGMKVTFFQSNHEGAIIDEIHRVRNIVDGIIINAGAYRQYLRSRMHATSDDDAHEPLIGVASGMGASSIRTGVSLPSASSARPSREGALRPGGPCRRPSRRLRVARTSILGARLCHRRR